MIEKPDPNRLQMWHTDLGIIFGFRTRQRLIHPCGKSEWLVYSRAINCEGDLEINDFWATDPCWYKAGMTQVQAIKAMKAYDKLHGRKTYFLGNL